MSPAHLERTVAFHALHHYRHPEWPEARNREAFGSLADPHPHDYRVTAVVSGPMDPVTGFVVDLPVLDSALERIVGPLRNADLNRVIPRFADGGQLPSCENLARWFHEELSDSLPAGLRLRRVRVAESETLAASYPAD